MRPESDMRMHLFCALRQNVVYFMRASALGTRYAIVRLFLLYINSPDRCCMFFWQAAQHYYARHSLTLCGAAL